MLLHGEDVTEAIRAPEISRGASVVSARPVVRQKLLQLQRDLGHAAPRGAVLEGRDIGTVVFPDAQVKFFLTASDAARAQRRHAELAEKGTHVPLEEVLPRLKKVYATNPEAKIFIRGDRDAVHGNVTRMLDQIRSSGFSKISFEIKSQAASGIPGGAK